MGDSVGADGITRRRLLHALPAAALGLGRPARAAAPGVSSGEILVGQTITLQGGKNVYGNDAMLGIRAALEAANRTGGVNGRRVVLRTLDDDSDTTKAEANARQLVDQGVFVLFGSLEGAPARR